MAKTSKFVLPDLSNSTPNMLCDEMAKLSVIENYAKKMRAVYKEAYYAKMGIKPEDDTQPEVIYAAELFTATTSPSFPRRVNVTKLKDEYPEAAEACTEENFQLTTRFSLNQGVENPLVADLLEQLKKELDLE